MKFIEYARRRKQGYSIARSLTMANDAFSGPAHRADVAVIYIIGGIAALFAVYVLVGYIDQLA